MAKVCTLVALMFSSGFAIGGDETVETSGSSEARQSEPLEAQHDAETDADRVKEAFAALENASHWRQR